MDDDRRFRDVEAFYDARGGRRSGESDFGSWWTDSVRGYPYFRVSAVHDTGDVYAVNLASGEVELLANFGSGGCGERAGHGEACVYSAVDDLLRGWADCHQQLQWARHRLSVQ